MIFYDDGVLVMARGAPDYTLIHITESDQTVTVSLDCLVDIVEAAKEMAPAAKQEEL